MSLRGAIVKARGARRSKLVANTQKPMHNSNAQRRGCHAALAMTKFDIEETIRTRNEGLH